MGSRGPRCGVRPSSEWRGAAGTGWDGARSPREGRACGGLAGSRRRALGAPSVRSEVPWTRRNLRTLVSSVRVQMFSRRVPLPIMVTQRLFSLLFGYLRSSEVEAPETWETNPRRVYYVLANSQWIFPPTWLAVRLPLSQPQENSATRHVCSWKASPRLVSVPPVGQTLDRV